MIIDSPAGKIDISNFLPDIDIVGALQLGFYEPHVQNWIYQFAHGKCLDIGANIGIHSILMAKMKSNVTVIEGQEDVVDLLKRNFIDNNLPVPEVHTLFLGDGEPVNFVKVEDRCGSCYTTNKTDEPKTNGAFPTKRLYDVIDFQPDFIKMDIEGAEYNTIIYSEDIFVNANMVIELNKSASANFDQNINDLINVLFKLYGTIATINGVTNREDLIRKVDKENIVDVLCIKR